MVYPLSRKMLTASSTLAKILIYFFSGCQIWRNDGQDNNWTTHVCSLYLEKLVFLLLPYTTIVIIPSFFLNFVILSLLFISQCDFTPLQRDFAPILTMTRGKLRWLGTKSRWLVNGKGKIIKLRKIKIKSQLHCKVGTRTQISLVFTK